MRFILNLVLSRMRREKKRLLFVLLAIASSSCLVVWTIGGFQALFIDETVQEANFLGNYDLRVASNTFSGVGIDGRHMQFTSPTSRSYYSQEDASKGAPSGKRDGSSVGLTSPSAAREGDPGGNGGRPEHAGDESGSYGGRRPLAKGGLGNGGGRPDATGAPAKGGANGSRGRGRGTAPAIPGPLLASIRQDENVSLCDEVSSLRMFVYAPGTQSAILEDDDSADEGDRPTIKRSLEIAADELPEATNGVDPELLRQAFAAYRSTMGTPMGLGSGFFATTAQEAPFELEDGRWFHASAEGESAPREAVMSVAGAKKFKAKVGDPLILLGVSSLVGRAVYYQLEVVGIVDDPDLESFYVSRALGEEIAAASDAPLSTNALFVKVRDSAEKFKARWGEKLAASEPALEAVTRDELVRRRLELFKQEQSFKYQAVSGAVLAALAALFIVFTALNTSVDEQRRLIAFYRVSGLTRLQVALSILVEGAFLAIPGWIAGMLGGWALVFLISEKSTGLNWETVGFSFLCTVVGAIAAAMIPMLQSARVKPLEALGVRTGSMPYRKALRRQTRRLIAASVAGFALIGGDAALIRLSQIDTMKRAAIHSGIGVLSLALGVALLTPLAIRLTEAILVPIFGRLLRFDPRILRRELSGNASRVVAVAIALSVGGGLFVTMQIWGYSMLQPFLPARRVPDAFAAFLPTGLRPEAIDELKALPMVDAERFLPVAVEQAAFAEGSVPESAAQGPFANVVFFGVDVAKAFEGNDPMIGVRFRQGDPEDAWLAMKSGRGVVVTDSLSVVYKLNLGDTLKVVHPREPGRVLEYPIVGVVAFDGWQWLSKTGGVRRNFGRSGGLVFAREGVIASDYEIERSSYFWFDEPGDAPVDYEATETACDRIARKNLKRDLEERGESSALTASQTAYVKLSTRESLTESIMGRADKVIWGLSKTPLTTLAIAAIAVVGAIANSVRARRWQFGVMRALGMTRGAIVRMIVVEGATIGVVASITSFLFGYLAAQGALKLGRSMFGSLDPPLILPIGGLSLGFALTLVLCVAAALYPAIKTGRAEPLKLLQSGRVPD